MTDQFVSERFCRLPAAQTGARPLAGFETAGFSLRTDYPGVFGVLVRRRQQAPSHPNPTPSAGGKK
jgi:hypothetical protein